MDNKNTTYYAAVRIKEWGRSHERVDEFTNLEQVITNVPVTDRMVKSIARTSTYNQAHQDCKNWRVIDVKVISRKEFNRMRAEEDICGVGRTKSYGIRHEKGADTSKPVDGISPGDEWEDAMWDYYNFGEPHNRTYRAIVVLEKEDEEKRYVEFRIETDEELGQYETEYDNVPDVVAQWMDKDGWKSHCILVSHTEFLGIEDEEYNAKLAEFMSEYRRIITVYHG